MTLEMLRDIGKIGNYYGGLRIKREDGRCYWSIENWDGENWYEIPQYLFDALLRHEEERNSPDQARGESK